MRRTHAELRKKIDYDKLVKDMRSDFVQIPDHRAANVVHRLSDILMSGFAIFALKFPSLLSFEHQTPMEQENLRQLFGIGRICSDVQMRRVLDEVSPVHLQGLFPARFKQLGQLGVLDDYRFLKKYLLISIDGVSYFESTKVNCKRCLTSRHRDGSRSYSHAMLSAALVHPDRREVFTLGGEAIEKQDGSSKNDCELSASKRLQSMLYDSYKGMPFVLVEDALYANEPHVKLVRNHGWDFILNVKPASHKALFRLFEARKHRGDIKQHAIKKGKSGHHFYWMDNVVLNGKGNERINFLYYEQHLPNGKVKRFSWVTSLPLQHWTVYQIMQGGRARWKIENEQFNTLKNQGYHFEHNYGHGYNHLCNVMAQLMLLAFLTDQMIQAFNRTFNMVWEKAKAKVRVWEKIRAIYMTISVNSFKELFFVLAGLYKIQLE